jgi:putative transposase
MKAMRDLIFGITAVLYGGCQTLGYIGTFTWALLTPKAHLAARLLAVESQLAVHTLRIRQKKEPPPRFNQAFRLLWVILSKVWDQWRDHAHLMQPATVVKWHRTAFRIYWRWKSRRGRPEIPQQMQALIRRLSTENPLWSAERIRDTLVLLGYNPPCDDTIRKYMTTAMNPRDRSTTWLPFLRNHLDVSWAMDFFTVVTVNFAFLYVFVVFDHGRRKVIHFASTYSPSMEWVIQQLREATPFGEQPRYVFRDNDRIYGYGVQIFLTACDIEEVRISYRSPWQNPFVERFIGTLRRELLDHLIVLNQRHLDRLLKEFVDEYYHVARPHQGLAGDTPMGSDTPASIEEPADLISFPVCGGLHHRYERIAA